LTTPQCHESLGLSRLSHYGHLDRLDHRRFPCHYHPTLFAASPPRPTKEARRIKSHRLVPRWTIAPSSSAVLGESRRREIAESVVGRIPGISLLLVWLFQASYAEPRLLEIDQWLLSLLSSVAPFVAFAFSYTHLRVLVVGGCSKIMSTNRLGRDDSHHIPKERILSNKIRSRQLGDIGTGTLSAPVQPRRPLINN
jgi:hypothetical protein